MTKYDELRKQKMSQSFVYQPSEKNSLRSSFHYDDQPNINIQAPSEPFYTPHGTTHEFQKNKPQPKNAQSSIASKTTLDSKFTKPINPISSKQKE
jgi:hypothetical protein